ncbi:hypothetical protein R1sor_003723 [Riccia sorocarpa]|uniref:Uncharacterized protein n=1 Tax=Riccia sorocarpa TaxID=122646 RepID=A0ABD3H470_9MARC
MEQSPDTLNDRILRRFEAVRDKLISGNEGLQQLPISPSTSQAGWERSTIHAHRGETSQTVSGRRSQDKATDWRNQGNSSMQMDGINVNGRREAEFPPLQDVRDNQGTTRDGTTAVTAKSQGSPLPDMNVHVDQGEPRHNVWNTRPRIEEVRSSKRALNSSKSPGTLPHLHNPYNKLSTLGEEADSGADQDIQGSSRPRTPCVHDSQGVEGTTMDPLDTEEPLTPKNADGMEQHETRMETDNIEVESSPKNLHVQLQTSEKWADVMDEDPQAAARILKKKPTEGANTTPDRGNAQKRRVRELMDPKYQKVDSLSQLVTDRGDGADDPGDRGEDPLLPEKEDEPPDRGETGLVPNGHTEQITG